MSKKSVWNKGKHNGGKGGSLKGNNSLAAAKPLNQQSHSQDKQDSTEAGEAAVESRIDRVGRMNRDNWISRPVKSKSEKL